MVGAELHKTARRGQRFTRSTLVVPFQPVHFHTNMVGCTSDQRDHGGGAAHSKDKMCRRVQGGSRVPLWRSVIQLRISADLCICAFLFALFFLSQSYWIISLARRMSSGNIQHLLLSFLHTPTHVSRASLLSGSVLITLILTLFLWRVWTFKIIPVLYPQEPREVPYWIPCKWFFGCSAEESF